MDITPVTPKGSLLIGGYGNGRFTITGSVYDTAVLVLPDRVGLWKDVRVQEDILCLSQDSLTPLWTHGGVELVLIGTGTRSALLTPELRQRLKQHGIAVEIMNTGAAARTYNVLLSEGRQVAAALIPV